MKFPVFLALLGVFLSCGAPLHAKPAKQRAKYLITVTDDFIVDAWVNGRRVDDTSRQLLAEIFGATVERIDVPIYSGDWVVFNVVSNRMRWNGSSYFAVAGLLEPDKYGFVSSLKNGAWSACDNPRQAPKFIYQRKFGIENPAVEIPHLWGGGDELIRRYAGQEWNGTPLWGRGRNTWIKVLIR